jgi:hypothetical protein
MHHPHALLPIRSQDFLAFE